MKRSVILVLTLVLTALVFTGCRRKNTPPTTEPITMPTIAPTTMPTTAPTTQPTTAPTTQPTTPTDNAPIDGNMDPTEDTDNTTPERSRRAMPRGF